MRLLFLPSLVLAFLSTASSAGAQQQPVQQQPVQQQPVQQPAQPQPFVEQPAVQAQPSPQPQPVQEQRLVRQSSLYVNVPIFLTSTEWVRPGVGLHGRFGWEFGVVVPEVMVGVQTQFLDDRTVRGADNLNNFWFSLGARLQFLNPSRFVPFINVAARFNWFGFSDADDTSSSAYEFEPSVMGGLGLAVELTRSFGLEAALNTVVTFPVSTTFDAFDRGSQIMLQPWVGGTLYY